MSADRICGSAPDREESRVMPAPAPRRATRPKQVRPTPAVEGNLRVERAKRRARIEHKLERQRARRRFAVLLFLLLLAAVLISLTIWDQIQALFGL
jgi:predicted nucleic acid-binding Zn ribbon protein